MALSMLHLYPHYLQKCWCQWLRKLSNLLILCIFFSRNIFLCRKTTFIRTIHQQMHNQVMVQVGASKVGWWVFPLLPNKSLEGEVKAWPWTYQSFWLVDLNLQHPPSKTKDEMELGFTCWGVRCHPVSFSTLTTSAIVATVAFSLKPRSHLL